MLLSIPGSGRRKNMNAFWLILILMVCAALNIYPRIVWSRFQKEYNEQKEAKK